MLAILAGMYIGFGGILFLIVGTGTLDTWPYGVAKFLQGLAFCLGLVLVVVGGAELFTGNTLLIIPWLEKKISFSELVRNWGIVYFGNFLGSLILAIVVFYSRIYMNANGQMAELLLKVAEKKVGFSFGQALMLGILCNILVCLAVWMAYSAKNTSDKILAILFPITAFIAAGFEHSVANMFLIPFALFIKWFDPSLIGVVNVENLSICNFLMKNLLPVTLGNIIGGSGFVGLFYYFAFHQKTK
jgi:formate transporter